MRMRPAGLEPAAFGAGSRCSVPLSYGRGDDEKGGEGFEPPAPVKELPFSRRVHLAALPTSHVLIQCPRRDSNPRTPLRGVRQTGMTRFPTWGSTPFGASGTRCL